MKKALEVYLERKHLFQNPRVVRECPEELLEEELNIILDLIEPKLIESIGKTDKPIFFVRLPFSVKLKSYFSQYQYINILKNRILQKPPLGFQFEAMYTNSFKGWPHVVVIFKPCPWVR